MSDLFVAAEDDEAGAGWFAAFGSTQRPECNRAAAILRKPTLQLALSGIVGKTTEMNDLRALPKEGADVGASVEGTQEDTGSAGWVGLRWTRLLHQRAQAASEGHSLLERATRR